MIEFVGFWVAVAAAFALGWVARRGVSETTLHDDKELDLAYAQGVADERAASRKRGQELAEAIAPMRRPLPGLDSGAAAPYTGHWPQ